VALYESAEDCEAKLKAELDNDLKQFELRMMKERMAILEKHRYTLSKINRDGLNHDKILSTSAPIVDEPKSNLDNLKGPRLVRFEDDLTTCRISNESQICSPKPLNFNEQSQRPGDTSPKLRLNSAHQNCASSCKMELPKVELFMFNGDVTTYWNFIRQFELYIESKIEDPGLRLLYLMNYCEGEAKAAISDCMLLEPSVGYSKARALLKRWYGKLHVIARCLIESLISFPQVNPYDAHALMKLYLKMQTCLTTLEQLHFLADLNAMTTLERIVNKLPFDLRDRWFRQVVDIYADGREPSFRDLLTFVDKEEEIAQGRDLMMGTMSELKSQRTDRDVRIARGASRQPDKEKVGSTRFMNTTLTIF
jgi:Protein of unknown function (DUF1759)